MKVPTINKIVITVSAVSLLGLTGCNSSEEKIKDTASNIRQDIESLINGDVKLDDADIMVDAKGKYTLLNPDDMDQKIEFDISKHHWLMTGFNVNTQQKLWTNILSLHLSNSGKSYATKDRLYQNGDRVSYRRAVPFIITKCGEDLHNNSQDVGVNGGSYTVKYRVYIKSKITTVDDREKCTIDRTELFDGNLKVDETYEITAGQGLTRFHDNLNKTDYINKKLL